MTDMDHDFNTGILRPAEVQLLRDICDKVTAQPWFSPDPGRRKEFAILLLRLYRQGVVIPEKLEAIGMAAARARYASDKGLASPHGLWDRCVLVVEDEPLLAGEAQKQLANIGASVVGPASTVKDALAEDAQIDLALLDIMLDGEAVFPVAALLKMKKIPFAFISGRDKPDVPAAFRHVPVFSKPTDWTKVASFLIS
jgi:CheY-like chemotaxis protein